MNIEEVEEPETTKIYRQNPSPSVAATRKLRKFTDETNMQARNHENSDEICAQPVRHLDLATPAFYTYRKNPKCYHTVWGKNITFPNNTFTPTPTFQGSHHHHPVHLPTGQHPRWPSWPLIPSSLRVLRMWPFRSRTPLVPWRRFGEDGSFRKGREGGMWNWKYGDFVVVFWCFWKF